MNPHLARFFLLAAFQNGGHLVGGQCFGHVEMDMITIEMGGEDTGQIAPPKIEFCQTVRQTPWGDPGIEQVAVNAAIGAVEFKQACVARRAAGKVRKVITARERILQHHGPRLDTGNDRFGTRAVPRGRCPATKAPC